MYTLNARRRKWGWECLAILAVWAPFNGLAQQNIPPSQSFSWEQLRDRFLATNPTLQAARIGIEESHAQETTAFLRPNPDFSLSADGTQLTRYDGIYRPFAGTQISPGVSYLHERDHKRELRLDSAQKGTAVAQSQLEDQQRNLLFNLRGVFVQALQAKAVLALAQENLSYYDKTLQVSKDRKDAGDIAQVDLDRLELQRVQYETDLQNALVNLRTAKIQLLQLLNDRSPVENFDVTGPYDFRAEDSEPRRIAADRGGDPSGFKGGSAVGRLGQNRLHARGGQRQHRSDLERVDHAQPFFQQSV